MKTKPTGMSSKWLGYRHVVADSPPSRRKTTGPDLERLETIDSNRVVGMTVEDARLWLEQRGFHVEVFPAGVSVALTMNLDPRRRRIFERDGLVVRVGG